MAQPSNIYFVRHGQSQANLDRVIAGSRDSPLTPRGIEQAGQVAAAIVRQGIVFDVIFSSPQSRAYDTAKIIAQGIGYPVEAITVLEELREKMSGAFEGRHPDELFNASDDEVRQAGVELYENFAARLTLAREIVQNCGKQSVLIVAHSGTYRMSICLRDRLPPGAMTQQQKAANAELLLYPM